MNSILSKVFDVFVIGGGINGCGVARDASGRGYSVYLSEKNDISSGTSSASSKLIHGGLRYLENYEFSFVKKALKERDTLISIAPHIVKEARFILPYHKGLRPAWILKLGLMLYDNLYSSKFIKRSNSINIKSHATQTTLLESYSKGFEYSDCIADDSRLTVLNAIDAKNLGSVIKTRSKVIDIKQINGIWHIQTNNQISGENQTITAKVLINATGPWIDDFLKKSYQQNEVSNIRLVKGSHVVVKRIFNHHFSYIFQNEDGRIFFAIPWEKEFMFIGTTDVDFEEDLDNVLASEEEIDYILSSANNYFIKKITRNDVVSHWSGVRPLYDNDSNSAQKISRDYVIREESRLDQSALLNVFGGKLTTFRRLSEDVVDKVESILGKKKPSLTGSTPLPGGDFILSEKEKLINDLIQEYHFLDSNYLTRLFNLYGTSVNELLNGTSSVNDLGIHFGKDLYQIEVDYLMKEEFALFPDDVTQRRTKLYLLLDKDNLKELDAYMTKNR